MLGLDLDNPAVVSLVTSITRGCARKQPTTCSETWYAWFLA